MILKQSRKNNSKKTEQNSQTLSQGVSRASRSQSQASNKEPVTVDISGQRCFESSKSLAPRWVIGENVKGLTNIQDGVVFETVCSDLEGEGYEVRTFNIPAAGVQAPHRRERLWIVASLGQERTIQWRSPNKGSAEGMKHRINGQEGHRNEVEPKNVG